MNDNEQSPKFELPVPRVVGLAAIACFASLTGIYFIASSTSNTVGSGWAKLLIYAPLPLFVTFTILYRSDWHRQSRGAARMASLLVVSGLILAGVLAAIAVAVCVAGFYSIAVRQGIAGR
jgi:heme/copper-type cytochrome/quinol oxidase subunit 3